MPASPPTLRRNGLLKSRELVESDIADPTPRTFFD